MQDMNTAIITGAGSGIGRATALQLAQAGWRVVLVGRTQAKLRATADQCEHAAAINADLTDPSACRRIVDETVESFGRLDAVAHIAGHAPKMPLAELTDEIIDECLATNLGATIHLARAAWPTFVRQKRGILVNVSSVASFDPFPGFAVYAPAKAAVNMFTHCAAQEGAEHGIRAVCVAPGAVETPMLRSLFNETELPRDKALQPDEVAKVIVDCILGQRAFEPGQTIVVPSGWKEKKHLIFKHGIRGTRVVKAIVRLLSQRDPAG